MPDRPRYLTRSVTSSTCDIYNSSRSSCDRPRSYFLVPLAPCGLRDCQRRLNRALSVFRSIGFCACSFVMFIRATFCVSIYLFVYVSLVCVSMCSVSWLFWLSVVAKWLARKTPSRKPNPRRLEIKSRWRGYRHLRMYSRVILVLNSRIIRLRIFTLTWCPE